MTSRTALPLRAVLLAFMALPLVGAADQRLVDANARLDAALRVGANAPFRDLMARASARVRVARR